MALSHGCNHVTVVTKDIDRLVDFYARHFEAEVTIDLKEDGLRHVLIDLGNGFCLHPFQLDRSNAHAEGLPGLFSRGHIDHLAINFDRLEDFGEVRRRLVDDGASDGRIRDFGVVRIMSFRDPDGMECELAFWKDGQPLSMADSRVETHDEA
jgi:catechol 2,3-dioxygenase-like lactoylglutathione lyase family enzyme